MIKFIAKHLWKIIIGGVLVILTFGLINKFKH